MTDGLARAAKAAEQMTELSWDEAELRMLHYRYLAD
jgi:hypothetical protein